MVFDIFVIGGGVNGVAIARDAAGRGLKVALAEKDDLAGQTSSKSTKLIHGGLRYLEYFEFKLVRHALSEREILLKNMPHIARPMRFVLPMDPDMRFESRSTLSQWTNRLMPWAKGRRPKWMMRAGLFLYDHMGGRKLLPATSHLKLSKSKEGAPLRANIEDAYEYSDCWVDDSRLVALMARDAKKRGAKIMTRTKITQINRGSGIWVIVDDEGGIYQARNLVNATGPWVEELAKSVSGYQPDAGIKLVRGSHIITKRLYEHEKAYFFAGSDGRIIFAIPYEQEFTVIGTTEAAHETPDLKAECSDEERDYLCERASVYFKEEIKAEDVVSTYAGVRALYDDGASSATAATREYVLALNDDAAPIISVFGGKITTHRRLAEDVLAKLKPHLPSMGKPWTKTAPLNGGEFSPEEAAYRFELFQHRYPFLSEFSAYRLFHSYGLEAFDILGEAKSWADLGRSFGNGLSEREVDHLIEQEFAMSAEDVLWRRSKLGLHFKNIEKENLEAYIQKKIQGRKS